MEIIINNRVFNLIVANTFIKRFIGLMGKKNITYGIFIPKTKAIHTFFMSDNIDIIMIDKNNKVIFYKKNLNKNKIIIKKKAYHTIELPKNSIINLNIGDKLTIKN